MDAGGHRCEVHLRSAVGIDPLETAVIAGSALDVEGVGVPVGVEEASALALVSDGIVDEVLRRANFRFPTLSFNLSNAST